MRIGLLTAGGDCPGLNAAIRAVVTRVTASGSAVVGIRSGWEGLIKGETVPLDRDHVRGIVARGGTILGTSRMDPYVHGKGLVSAREAMAAAEIDCLLVIGGDGSLRTAARLCIIRGHHIGDADRDGEILEVQGDDGNPPYLVCWSDDGHEGLIFPGSDAYIEHKKAKRARANTG